jgi:murein L,D-transpeptidase YafK
MKSSILFTGFQSPWFFALASACLISTQTLAESGPLAVASLPEQTSFFSPFCLVVDKSTRSLSVWKTTSAKLQKVAEFPADFGKNAGAKISEGDHRTPEGIYFFQEKKEGQNLDFKTYGRLAFTTDYPNYFDQLDGKSGNGIWLHSVPEEVPLTRGSRGCVVVRNETVTKLAEYIKLGATPLIIENKIELISDETRSVKTSALTAVLENWQRSWASKDTTSYIKNYSSSFKSQGMNREAWEKHKSRLAGLAKSISVELSQPVIFVHGNRAVVRFLQSYTSDLKSDLGEKTLYLIAENLDATSKKSDWKIIGELWQANSSESAKAELRDFPFQTKGLAGI